jgi:plastocyanin
MTPIRTAGLLVAGALLLAGCGGSEASKGGYAKGPSTQGKAKPAPAGGGSPKVTMTNISFKPPTLTARAGQTVTWTNQDGVPHDVKAASFKSKILQPGQSYSYKLAKPGTIDYVCTIHPNMKATIRVVG